MLLKNKKVCANCIHRYSEHKQLEYDHYEPSKCSVFNGKECEDIWNTTCEHFDFKNNTMLYKVRTGDILLCKDKSHDRMQMYLITYDSCDGYSLICLTCGDKIGSYKHNKELLLHDMKNFLNVVQIILKEIIINFVTTQYKMSPKLICHDICEEHELGVEIEL